MASGEAVPLLGPRMRTRCGDAHAGVAAAAGCDPGPPAVRWFAGEPESRVGGCLYSRKSSAVIRSAASAAENTSAISCTPSLSSLLSSAESSADPSSSASSKASISFSPWTASECRSASGRPPRSALGEDAGRRPTSVPSPAGTPARLPASTSFATVSPKSLLPYDVAERKRGPARLRRTSSNCAEPVRRLGVGPGYAAAARAAARFTSPMVTLR
jgi:hypothetical protein